MHCTIIVLDRADTALYQILPMLQEPVHIAAKFGKRFHPAFCQTLNGVQGNQAHERAHTEFVVTAIGIAQGVVEEPITLAPQLVADAPHLLHRRADIHVVLEKFGSERFVGRIFSCQLQRNAHQVEAEHAHPARGVRLLQRYAIGEFLTAVDHRDVVETQEAAFKNIVASLSTLFTHQAKLMSSLWKQRSRNRRSALPERMRSMLYTRHTAQACTGGFKSESSHSYAGIWPLGCWNCSKRRSQSCSLANSASTKARATQWKARSQAANQGYSHLSGIDRTRIELRCCQRLLRMWCRDSGGGQCGLSPSSQADTSNKYICLLHSMPAKA